MITNRTYGIDNDVLAYNARIVAGGNQSLSMQNLRQLNQFVISIKKIGLWHNMICWPLRANQNAGTGSIAYSLGGLSIYNATLVGGIWGVNGIDLSTSDSMSSSINSPNQDFSLFFCGAGTGSQPSFGQYFGLQNANAFSNNQSVIQDDGSGSSLNLQMRNSGSVGFTTNTISKPFSNRNSFVFISASVKNSTSLLNIRNLGASTQNTGTYISGTATLNRMQLNGRWNGSSVQLQNPIIASFCGYIMPADNENMSLLYSLYKSTLGQGLGLP